MYIERFDLRDAPGLPGGLLLAGMRPGLVLLVGPNASGKSTVGRVIRGMLWSEHTPSDHYAHGVWHLEVGGTEIHAALKYGRTDWDGLGQSPSTALSSAWNLTLAELLKVDGSSDLAIAHAIQRELDGGYDLGSADPGLADPRPKWRVRRPFDDASAALRTLLNTTDALQEDEDRLPALDEKREAAANAPARLEDVRDAIKRRAGLVQLAKHRADLTEFPEHLADLPIDATETATGLGDTRDEWRDEVLRRHATETDFTKSVDALAFPTGTPSESVAADLARRAAELVEHARTRDGLRAAHTAAETEIETRSRQVWSTPDSTSLPSREALETVGAHSAELAAKRAELGGLGVDGDDGSDPLPDETRDKLIEARGRLREWIHTPRQIAVALSPARRTIPALALLALGVLALLVGAVIGGLVWAVVGLGIVAIAFLCFGLAIGLWIGPAAGTTPQPISSEVDHIAGRHEAAGHEVPEAWTLDAVGARIAAIDGRLREDDAARSRADAALTLNDRRAKLETVIKKLDDALNTAVDGLGLAPQLFGLPLIVQAERILGLANAQVAHEKAKRADDEADVAHTTELRALVDALAALELTDLPVLDDAGSIAIAANRIQTRRGDLVRAERERENAKAERIEAEKKRDKAEAAFDTHLARCGVTADTMGTLHALEEQRTRYTEILDKKKLLDLQLEELDARVPEDLLDESVDLEAEEERLDDLKEELESTLKKITEIKANIEARTEGRSVQKAISDRERAWDALVVNRDQQRLQAARHALVDWLRTHRSATDAPDLLKRARHWFLRFTRNRHELRVGPHGDFRAWDSHTHQHQSLGQLSDGTRIQLLLAARLSFIEHTEQDGPAVPLFLDEVLSTTDPQRFAAVAHAVLDLARAGRQVFYATSSPAEVAAWRQQAAKEGFDAPQIQRLGAAATDAQWDPAPATPAKRASVPAPTDNAITWVATLGLQRPSLHTAVGAWPLALVLYDDLTTAHVAAEQGLLHVGQLDLADAGLRLPIDPAVLARARARVCALAAAIEGLRVGRGKPVTWAAVTDSGAISASFIERAKPLLETHGDAPRAFVDAVGTLPRFRGDRKAALEEYLVHHGILDTRDTLALSAIVASAQRACRTDLNDGTLVFGDVGPWVRFACEVVGVTP